MFKNDDELNEFIDEVTDGAYNLPCVEVIFKLVKHMHPCGDDRIKKIVTELAAEGIQICIAADIWYSYSYVCAYFLDTFQQYTLVKSVRSKSHTFSCLTGGRTVFLTFESPVMR